MVIPNFRVNVREVTEINSVDSALLIQTSDQIIFTDQGVVMQLMNVCMDVVRLVTFN